MRRDVDALGGETFDLLILGGGITGAGVALDAATRGWRVALIDKGDFAGGTSSVSSKLVHGGLRYLEHGYFHLVHEALHERAWLLRAAPHLVHPLRFLLPFYRGARVSPWRWRVGLTLYDLLAGAANIARSRPLCLQQMQGQAPALLADGLTGGACYFDAQMDDARLCLEVLQTAAQHGAEVANYVEAIQFVKSGGIIAGAVARDHVGRHEISIRARQVLNATGPWVDAVSCLAGDDAGPRLAPTKGVHLILPDRALNSALLLLHPRDGRVIFVIPWLGKTLLGTTDTVTTEGPDALAVSAQERDYLLEAWRHYFPGDRDPSVLGAFAGLRPLIRFDSREPSARSREFRLFESPSGLVSVAGGKYTTFRAMAAEITDRLGRRLGKRQRCRTGTLVLHGAPSEPWGAFRDRQIAALVREEKFDEAIASRLVDRYGASVEAVIPYLRDPAARKPLAPGEPEIAGELMYQREREMALFPSDHWLRRMRLGLYAGESKLSGSAS